MVKTIIKYDKPYLGTCILDLSKLLMYQFHYDVINKKYGDKVSLLFTDTDSLCYEVNTDDVYADLKTTKEFLTFLIIPNPTLAMTRPIRRSLVSSRTRQMVNSSLSLSGYDQNFTHTSLKVMSIVI